ncbi:MAG: glutathione peroxidase [Dehalococcoidia bacterium]|nr:glutathione peroxidase [Dehalococcoidia bacterium]
MANVLHYTMERLGGGEQSLDDYRGKVLLLVNVASHCGNTPQYKTLQELYKRYQSKGFEVLGFPANNFGAQEPGTDKEISAFCEAKYGVTFPMFSKISVKGKDMHLLYAEMTAEPKPLGGEVTWNFQKYLADRQGNIVAKFSPSCSPDDRALVAKLEELLGH